MEAIPSEPMAPPMPKAAITMAWSPGPPPSRSLIRNGISTSNGPIIARIISEANSSVASSQGVRTM